MVLQTPTHGAMDLVMSSPLCSHACILSLIPKPEASCSLLLPGSGSSKSLLCHGNGAQVAQNLTVEVSLALRLYILRCNPRDGLRSLLTIFIVLCHLPSLPWVNNPFGLTILVLVWNGGALYPAHAHWGQLALCLYPPGDSSSLTGNCKPQMLSMELHPTQG